MINLLDGETLTFSYGSNMKTAYLRDYCPTGRPVMSP